MKKVENYCYVEFFSFASLLFFSERTKWIKKNIKPTKDALNEVFGGNLSTWKVSLWKNIIIINMKKVKTTFYILTFENSSKI